MKTISNTFEMTEAVIELISNKICQPGSAYTYTLYPDTSDDKPSTSIKIYNSDDILVVFIHNTFVEIKDIIAEELNKVLRKEHHEKVKAIINTLSIEEMQYIYSTFLPVDIPEEVYTQFKYFNTEEMQFQQSTIRDDVLSFECTQNIMEIKNKVLEDVRKQWMI